jgi:hypothetical protein
MELLIIYYLNICILGDTACTVYSVPGEEQLIVFSMCDKLRTPTNITHSLEDETLIIIRGKCATI